MEVHLAASESCSLVDSVWIFGSCLVTNRPNDIDLLVVYDPASSLEVSGVLSCREVLAAHLLSVLQLKPHIILLSRDEELELKFSESEGGRKIWP